MAKKSKQPRCAIINGVCPENGNPEKGDYCPHWREYVMQHKDTGEHKVQSTCDIPVMHDWARSTHEAGWLAGQMVTKTANAFAHGNEHALVEMKRLEGELAPVLQLIRDRDEMVRRAQQVEGGGNGRLVAENP